MCADSVGFRERSEGEPGANLRKWVMQYMWITLCRTDIYLLDSSGAAGWKEGLKWVETSRSRPSMTIMWSADDRRSLQHCDGALFQTPGSDLAAFVVPVLKKESLVLIKAKQR